MASRKVSVMEKLKNDFLQVRNDDRPATFKDTLKDMAEASSLHGIPKIVNSRQIVVKVLWCLLFLGAFSVFTIQLYHLFMTYYSYPSQTSVSLKFSPIAFPAITLCNMNPVRKSNLQKVQELQDVVKSYSNSNMHGAFRKKREATEEKKETSQDLPIQSSDTKFCKEGEGCAYKKSENKKKSYDWKNDADQEIVSKILDQTEANIELGDKQVPIDQTNSKMFSEQNNHENTYVENLTPYISKQSDEPIDSLQNRPVYSEHSSFPNAKDYYQIIQNLIDIPRTFVTRPEPLLKGMRRRKRQAVESSSEFQSTSSVYDSTTKIAPSPAGVTLTTSSVQQSSTLNIFPSPSDSSAADVSVQQSSTVEISPSPSDSSAADVSVQQSSAIEISPSPSDSSAADVSVQQSSTVEISPSPSDSSAADVSVQQSSTVEISPSPSDSSAADISVQQSSTIEMSPSPSDSSIVDRSLQLSNTAEISSSQSNPSNATDFVLQPGSPYNPYSSKYSNSYSSSNSYYSTYNDYDYYGWASWYSASYYDYGTYWSSWSDSSNMFFYDQLSSSKDEWDERVDTFRQITKDENLTMRKTIGHQKEDMILSATFAGRVQNVSRFQNFMSTEYGNCYTIESPKFVAWRSGPDYGIKLTLNLEIDEYVDNFSTGYGIRIVFHEPGTYPMPSHEGITLSPATETNIGLRLVRISRLGEPHGSCVDGMDFATRYKKKYSISACHEFCRIHRSIQECDCIPVEAPDEIHFNLTALPVCNVSQISVKKCLLDVDVLFDDGKFVCDCNGPCEETVYAKTMSSTYWPTDDYLAILIKDVCEKKNASSYWSNVCHNFKSMDYWELDKFRYNFLRVLIYYEDLNYESITEEPMYESVRFLSDIGGAMGLFLGASVLSFVEAVQLILEVILYMKNKRDMKNRVIDIKQQICE